MQASIQLDAAKQARDSCIAAADGKILSGHTRETQVAFSFVFDQTRWNDINCYNKVGTYFIDERLCTIKNCI